MHNLQTKPDSWQTYLRNFKSKRSYIAFRTHPGTKHQCEYLAGIDKARRRREIFDRDGWRCVDCGTAITWETGEWAHGGSTKMERCDCKENGKTKCRRCHVLEHGRFVRNA